jgi:hypothetical protein
MVTFPFFPFKNHPSQSYSPYSRASIEVKTGFPDSANFAMTRPLIHWHIVLWRPRYAKGRTTGAQTARAAKNGPQTFGSSHKKQNDKCWQFAQWLYEHWHIAAVTAWYANGRCPICHSRGCGCWVVAKSTVSREPVFT